MLTIILSIIFLLLIFVFLYKKLHDDFNYFKKMGITNPPPVPLLGNMSFLFCGNKGISEKLIEFYNHSPNSKIMGFFDFTYHVFIIRDPKLMKRMLVRDFLHFEDRLPVAQKDVDELFSYNLMSMQGQEWRDMRSTLTPLFTMKKIKIMFPLVIHCIEQFIDHLKFSIESTAAATKSENIEMKKINYSVLKLCENYANDVIVSCAFGLESNSFGDDHDSLFLRIGDEIKLIQSLKTVFKSILIHFAPKLSKFLDIRLMDKRVRNIFCDLVLQAMKMREKQGINRPDMIQLLLELQHGKYDDLHEDGVSYHLADDHVKMVKGNLKRNWSNVELMAQCFLFFFAGFETISHLLMYLCYELASNKDVQERLYEEILEVQKNLKGSPLSYDNFRNMRYLLMVINEALRKWPPFVATDRICVQDYFYDDSKMEDNDEFTKDFHGNEEQKGNLKFNIKKGNGIFLPIYAFHMDEKNFPNPHKFDPERFSEENIHKNNMDAFIPFGVGPRYCIGVNFALMQVKAVVYHLLLNFKLTLPKEMKHPLKMKKSLFGLKPERAIKIEFELRSA